MSQWYDEAIIEIKSGAGGKGCESYNYRTDHKREPHGGNGGNGGNVWIEADSNASGLLLFKFNQHFYAESGDQGGSNEKAGRSGRDVRIKVPCGTTVYNAKNGLRIRDLKFPGDKVLAAKGGRGGAGNHTGKGAQMGVPAITLEIRLDLKVVADIFILGTPGCGKSTLLHQLTHTRLPETYYPFSTQSPQLGVYEAKDETRTVLCELPSLIRGSHEGHGIGNRYLKHLGRAKLLFLVIEPDSPFAPSVREAFEILREEIKFANEEFLKCPFFCIINKTDLLGSKPAKAKLEREAKKFKAPTYFVSAVSGLGIKKLISDARKKIKNG